MKETERDTQNYRRIGKFVVDLAVAEIRVYANRRQQYDDDILWGHNALPWRFEICGSQRILWLWNEERLRNKLGARSSRAHGFDKGSYPEAMRSRRARSQFVP